MSLFPWSKARVEKDAEVAEAIARQQEATEKLARALRDARGVELREMIEGLIPLRRKPTRDNR